MEEIARFVTLARSDRFTITDLCEQFGISRRTGYKHLGRFAAEGMPGLQPRSHRPHTFPQRTDATVEALVLGERRLHRTWGPKKLQRGAGGEVRHRGTASVQHARRDPAPTRAECAAASADSASTTDRWCIRPTMLEITHICRCRERIRGQYRSVATGHATLLYYQEPGRAPEPDSHPAWQSW